MELMFNDVVRISRQGCEGFYRVIAIAPRFTRVILYRLAPLSAKQVQEERRSKKAQASSKVAQRLQKKNYLELSGDEVDKLIRTGLAKRVEWTSMRSTMRDRQSDSAKQRKQQNDRVAIMAEFLDSLKIQEALLSKRGIGTLVQTAVATHHCARSKVYKFAELLFTRGITSASLGLDHERCGAKGKPRPWGRKRHKPGRQSNAHVHGSLKAVCRKGITLRQRGRIVASYLRHASEHKHRFPAIWPHIIEDVYVEAYTESDTGPVPIIPPAEKLPTKASVRSIIDAEIDVLVRLKKKTTEGHWERNLVGSKGRSYRGVAGPGHEYAVDATIGDVYLRSSINRAWIIGRPVVYFVVDIWSTAIVGFHVCLSGPSWSTAQSALFATLSAPALVADLWGITYQPFLDPLPGAPAKLLSDRGEFFCARARIVAQVCGWSCGFNPPYLPKLKGMVEVLHRILKDQQFTWMPGAFDARRKELELKPQARDSAFTIRAYAQSIAILVHVYNLTADRRRRLTADMIAAGVPATPAGLWRYGHSIGIGYRKNVDRDLVLTHLLPQCDLNITREGAFFNQLEYEGPFISDGDLTSRARHLGAMQCAANFFPGSTSRLWVPSSHRKDHGELRLSSTALAKPGTTHDEWRDARAVATFDNARLEHERTAAAVLAMAERRNLAASEVKATRAAEAAYQGPKPTIGEARKVEIESANPGTAQKHDELAYDQPGQSVYERLFADSVSV